MNPISTALKKKIGGVKNKVIDVASDVLSAPAQLKYKINKAQVDSDVAGIKKAREYGNAPSFDERGMPTDAFKARSMRDAIKNKYK